MTFQPKPSYLPTDVKHYRAPRRPMQYALMALAACLALVSYVEPQPSTFEAEAGQAVAAVLMPAAAPIFEPAHALERLSPPVQCSGRSRHGLWIAHSGDRKRTGRRCI